MLNLWLANHESRAKIKTWRCRIGRRIGQHHPGCDATADVNERLRLPPLVRDLEIDYTALSLVAPEKAHCRYKLEGRDDDWREGGNRRQAFYDDLPPGNYRFRLSACNDSGVWNQAGIFLDFAVAPAYFQTGLFRAACVARL